MSKKVAVLILNWNRWKDTLECLDSVFNISYPLYKIIIVDNNSSDDSVVRIKKWAQDKNLSYKEYEEGEGEKFSFDKGIILIKNRENYGFAKGNNIGINYILDYSDADYIFLLNNDAVIKDADIFQKMIRIIDKGIYSERIYWSKKGVTLDCQGATIDGKGSNTLGIIFEDGATENVIKNCNIRRYGFGIYSNLDPGKAAWENRIFNNKGEIKYNLSSILYSI